MAEKKTGLLPESERQVWHAPQKDVPTKSAEARKRAKSPKSQPAQQVKWKAPAKAEERPEEPSPPVKAAKTEAPAEPKRSAAPAKAKERPEEPPAPVRTVTPPPVKPEEPPPPKKPTKPARRALEIVKTVLTWLVVVAAACMMVFTVVSVTTFDRNDRSLFGYKAYIVRSDSMRATDFKAGDLILVKEVDPATLQEGDIIAFTSQGAASYGEVITHKIRSRITTQQGDPAFITYGTTTDTDDEAPVTYEYILGKYRVTIPGVGRLFAFLKTAPGYACCILLPFVILIAMQGANSIRLFRRYKREQAAALQSERAQVAAERKETQHMLAELQKLRAEMGLADRTNPPSDAPGAP